MKTSKLSDCGIYFNEDGSVSVFGGSPVNGNARWLTDADGWVSPHSSFWHMSLNCWNKEFPSLRAAMIALRKELEE